MMFSIAALPWDVATKESSCEQSHPSGQSKENLVVSTVGAKATKKRLFHGTNLLALVVPSKLETTGFAKQIAVTLRL